MGSATLDALNEGIAEAEKLAPAKPAAATKKSAPKKKAPAKPVAPKPAAAAPVAQAAAAAPAPAAQPGMAIISDPDGTEATINKYGQDFELKDVSTVDEIDEMSDLPPGVAQVKDIKGKKIVFWQLARKNIQSNRRAPFCTPILRNNPYFQHVDDKYFDVHNQLSNGDLIVCYTSEEMSRAYHKKRRASVDQRNEFLFGKGGVRSTESQMVDGDNVESSYEQGITVNSDRSVFDRASGRAA